MWELLCDQTWLLIRPKNKKRINGIFCSSNEQDRFRSTNNVYLVVHNCLQTFDALMLHPVPLRITATSKIYYEWVKRLYLDMIWRWLETTVLYRIKIIYKKRAMILTKNCPNSSFFSILHFPKHQWGILSLWLGADGYVKKNKIYICSIKNIFDPRSTYKITLWI